MPVQLILFAWTDGTCKICFVSPLIVFLSSHTQSRDAEIKKAVTNALDVPATSAAKNSEQYLPNSSST